jgi:hypothetical protein
MNLHLVGRNIALSAAAVAILLRAEFETADLIVPDFPHSRDHGETALHRRSSDVASVNRLS